jgi:hypothetical protein
MTIGTYINPPARQTGPVYHEAAPDDQVEPLASHLDPESLDADHNSMTSRPRVPPASSRRWASLACSAG